MFIGRECAPPPGIHELLPGDFVEADLELVVFPGTAAAYYGPDKAFQAVLARDADTWRMVQREAAGHDLQPDVRRGLVLQPYPLRVAVDAHQAAEVRLRGGPGYVPVTFAGLTAPDGYVLSVDDQPLQQAVHGNDFWQTDYDAAAQRWRQTFNIALSTNHVHTVRLERKR